MTTKAGLYARVSTHDQNIKTQLVALRKYTEDNNIRVYNEYKDIGESGSKDSRPAFDQMLQDMRHNKIDMIIVYKLDRIGRSLPHLLSLFSEFNKRKVEFVSTTQNIDTTTPEGRFFLRILMLVAEYERELIQNRIYAGLDRARKEGKQIGRPKTKVNKYEIYRLRSDGLSMRQISIQTGHSLSMIQRCLNKQGVSKPTP